MIVAGGVYVERCMEPEWQQVFGSAGRAAIALVPAFGEVTLMTSATEGMRRRVDALAAVYGFVAQCADSSVAIAFDYVHPLAVPLISPPPNTVERQPPLKANADIVLRFGMLETDVIVDAEIAVYDPQSAFTPERFHANGSRARRFAVVLNGFEAAALTKQSSVEDAARQILSEDGAEVVVVKRGSRGAVVATVDGIETVPAYRSESVWSIGSGDIFAAAFTFFWGRTGLPPREAADLASRAVSVYCESRSMPLLDPAELSDRVPVTWKAGRVYLAGPFFNLAQRWLIEEARNAFQAQGLQVFSPLHDVGPGTAAQVAPADLEGLCKCDRMLALIDGADVGTIFEVGYARARDLPIVAFAQAMPPEDLKMIVGSGVRVVADFTTAIFQTAWL
jgi:nucleoside 2-deoxyribosyltransferase-like protein/pfkB family carbohydrate kinase